MGKGKKENNLLEKRVDTAVFNPQIIWPVKKNNCLYPVPLDSNPQSSPPETGTYAYGLGRRAGEGRAGGPSAHLPGSTAACSWAKRQQSAYSRNHKSTESQGLSTASFLESPENPSGHPTKGHPQSKQTTFQPATKATDPVFTLTQQRTSALPETH